MARYADAERLLSVALGGPGARRFPVMRSYAAINRAFFLDFRRGHIDRAAFDLDAAITDLEAREGDDVLVYRSWAHSYRGVMLGYLGRWTEALDVIDRWPELAVRQGFGRLMEQSLTWHRLAHLAGLRRWTELEAELRRAAPLAVRNPDTTYAYRYRAAMAGLAAHRGDTAGVAHAIETVRDAPAAPFPAR